MIGLEQTGKHFILEVIWTPAHKAPLPLPQDSQVFTRELVQVLWIQAHEVSPFFGHVMVGDSEYLQNTAIVQDALPIIWIALPELAEILPERPGL